MSTLTIALIIIVGVLGICIAMCPLLRKRPGFRRRSGGPTYMGPERRCARDAKDVKVAKSLYEKGNE